jgi:hypothetical protein
VVDLAVAVVEAAAVVAVEAEEEEAAGETRINNLVHDCQDPGLRSDANGRMENPGS